MPTARTNKRKYEYGEIRFLDIIAISDDSGNAIAIARQKSSFAVFNIVLLNIVGVCTNLTVMVTTLIVLYKNRKNPKEQ
jgi:hypothetical protein